MADCKRTGSSVMSIPLYWWTDKPNFGDMLSPIIVSHFAQQSVHFSASPGKLLAAGSILGWAAKETDIVWGSGLLYPARLPKTLTVAAVRGPKTREIFLEQGIDCPAIYGDPGWLMPQIYNPTIEKRYKTAVLPHYSDNILKRLAAEANVKLLSAGNSPFEVIDGILAAEQLITSSLHGLIVAEAYGIPVVLVRNSNLQGIEHFKFIDYFQSTGRTDYTLWDASIEDAVKKIPEFPKPEPIDTEKLASVFPLEHCQHLLSDRTVPSSKVNSKIASPQLSERNFALSPNITNALLAQGLKFFQEEQFHEANRIFHEAASLPGGKEIWRWKSLGFCPTVIDSEKSIDRYWRQLEHGLDLAIAAKFPIDWRTLPTDGFTPSFNLPHHGRCCRSLKEKFAQIFELAFPHKRPSRTDIRKNHKKIRVGFVVAPGHHLGFIRVNRSILARLNPNKFEVYLFGDGRCHTVCSKRIRRNDLTLVNFGSNFVETVARLRDMQCDVVYHWKIGGGPIDYFLPFTNPAPVQCTSLGTHDTSGVSATDYFISSKLLECPDAQTHYTERLVCLDSYPTAHEPEPRAEATRSELKLPEKGALYFCPHNPAKYHPCFDRYLKRILERDMNGHIILLTGNRPLPAKALAERLRHSLGELLMTRIILRSIIPHDQYRKYFSVATCMLDSPVYAGDLTAHDAFDAGVPIVTQEGPYLVERYTLGLYRMMDMASLVTDCEDQYVDLAVRLGTDADFNHEVRCRIIERKEAIFNTNQVVKEYESFFENVTS